MDRKSKYRLLPPTIQISIVIKIERIDLYLGKNTIFIDLFLSLIAFAIKDTEFVLIMASTDFFQLLQSQ